MGNLPTFSVFLYIISALYTFLRPKKLFKKSRSSQNKLLLFVDVFKIFKNKKINAGNYFNLLL